MKKSEPQKKYLSVSLTAYTKKALTLFSFMLMSFTIMAQDITVTGVIKNESGEPLIGVTIQDVQMGTGVITNLEGRYELKASPEAPLTFSYIGYKTQTVKVNSRTTLNITMQEDIALLDDVVVIGYGSVRRKDLTGSVGSIKPDQITKFPASNVTEMLRGQAAGVQVSLDTGAPGSPSNIRIRGNRSIKGNNSPLYVVDGMMVPNIDNIDPSDIQAIDILKDASSQAIYGSRASNGVILITTRRGVAGKTTVSVNSSLGFHEFYKNFDLYSPKEYLELRYWGMANSGTAGIGTIDNMNLDKVLGDATMQDTWAKKNFVNWEKEMFQTAVIHKHDISISGGTDKVKYLTSIGFIDQEGIVKTTEFQRGNFRTNIDAAPYKWLDLSTSFSYARSEQNLPNSSFFHILTMSPLAQAYNDDGSVRTYGTSTQGDINPLLRNSAAKERKRSDYLTLGFNATFKLYKGLSYRFGVNILDNNRDEGTYLSRKYPGSTGEGSTTDFKRKSYIIDNVVNYEFPIKNEKHSLKATLIQTIDHERSVTTKINFDNSATDQFKWNVVQNSVIKNVNRTITPKRSVSFAGRIQYDFMGRILVTASFRRDAASVFSDNNKWSNFPSAAIAWRLSEEQFLKDVSWLDMLKVRVSYGKVGNLGIDPYTTLGVTSAKEYLLGNNLNIGFLPTKDLPNPNLKWETTSSFNYGIDMSIFNGRLTATMDYYHSKTKDLLQDLGLPTSSSYSVMLMNIGETSGRGFELDLKGSVIRKKDFEWNLGFSISTNKTNVEKLFMNMPRDLSNNLYVGSPINAFRDHVFNGIWQTGETPLPHEYMGTMPRPGDIKILDYDGDGKITIEDQKIYSTDPKWFATISTSLAYKGIDFAAEFYTAQGATKKNPLYSDDMLGGGFYGKKNGIRVVDYWTADNPSKTMPRPQTSALVPYASTLGVQDASYFRLRSVSIGYTLPVNFTKKAFIQNARVYFTATNIFTSTDYKSFSPEVTPSGTAYPEPKTYAFGINLTF